MPPVFCLLLWLQVADPSAEGLKALEAKDYSAAVNHFQRVVQADPKDYAAHFHLGLAHSLLNHTESAIAAYQQVLQLKPGLYEAELNLGVLFLSAKKPAEALPLLEGAAARKPDQFRPRYYWAEALLETGDAAKAAPVYVEALKLDPKSASAELGLGRAMARQKRLDEAAPHFRKAAELDPTFRDVLLELAALYEQAKSRDEAIAIYRQFPENAAAQERIGALLLAGNETAAAIPELEKAVAKDPTPANRVALSTAYRKEHKLDKALQQMQLAVAADPNNFDLRMVHGTLLRDQKKYSPAAREFFEATRLKRESREAWSELASMLTLLENFPQALAALDRVSALGGETAGHMFFRAIILDKTKQYEPALAAYEKFLGAAEGKFPNEEFQARQRVRIIKKELSRRR
ncbi:MAG: tetratricopeptide repeat protein [Bryobacteraceae bacterium]